MSLLHPKPKSLGMAPEPKPAPQAVVKVDLPPKSNVFIKIEACCQACGSLLHYRRAEDTILLYHLPSKCVNDGLAYAPATLNLNVVDNPKWIEK